MRTRRSAHETRIFDPVAADRTRERSQQAVYVAAGAVVLAAAVAATAERAWVAVTAGVVVGASLAALCVAGMWRWQSRLSWGRELSRYGIDPNGIARSDVVAAVVRWSARHLTHKEFADQIVEPARTLSTAALDDTTAAYALLDATIRRMAMRGYVEIGWDTHSVACHSMVTTSPGTLEGVEMVVDQLRSTPAKAVISELPPWLRGLPDRLQWVIVRLRRQEPVAAARHLLNSYGGHGPVGEAAVGYLDALQASAVPVPV